MTPGKDQKSKQRCQDLCWKVHDRAQSFVLRSYTIYDYVTDTFPLVRSSVRSKQLLCLARSQDQNREQKQKKSLSAFITTYMATLTLWENTIFPYDRSSLTTHKHKHKNPFTNSQVFNIEIKCLVFYLATPNKIQSLASPFLDLLTFVMLYIGAISIDIPCYF